MSRQPDLQLTVGVSEVKREVVNQDQILLSSSISSLEAVEKKVFLIDIYNLNCDLVSYQ